MRIDVDKVRVARLRKGLLIGELADVTGFSVGSMKRACCGGHAGLRVARAIAKAIDVPLAEILLDLEPEATNA